MPTDPRAESIVKEYQWLKTDRSSFTNNWAEVEELVVPIRGSNVGSAIRRSPGQIISSRIFDSTAIFANEQFASILASQLVNPSLKWLELYFRSPTLNENQEGKDWQAKRRDILLSVFGEPATHFYQAVHEFFLDGGGYGTAAMDVIENVGGDPPVVFITRPVQSVFIKENSLGLVDTVFILYKWRAMEAIDFYGDEAPARVKDAFKKNLKTEFEFVQVIRPRRNRDGTKLDSKNKKIESIHVFLFDKSIVRESGFDEPPVIISRLAKLSGESYGRGPGMNLLPEIRMLQRMWEVLIQSAQKRAAPPLLIPDEGVIGPMRLVPNGTTIIRQGLKNKPEYLQSTGDIEIGLEMIRLVQEKILRGFFLNPADFVPPVARVTATAILDRRDERFRRMTPLISRYQSEFLRGLIIRLLGILERTGIMPKRPGSIPAGSVTNVRFTSPAAQAQQLTDAESITRFMSSALVFLELDPDSVTEINAPKAIRKLHQVLQAPDILNTDIESRTLRKGRQEARAQKQQSEIDEQNARIAERTSKALKNANDSETT